MLLVVSPLLGREVLPLQSRFIPEVLPFGEVGRLHLELQLSDSANQSFSAPSLNRIPAPEGLSLNFVGQRQEMRFATGQGRSWTVIYEFQVSALKNGDFELEAYQFEHAGRVFEVQPATIRVTGDADAFAERQRKMFFIEWSQLPDEIFVGQMVEAELNLYVSTEINQLQFDLPQLIGDDWQVRGLQQERERDQVRLPEGTYQRLRWPVVVSPLRSGTFDLSASLNVLALIPGSDPRRRDVWGMSMMGQRQRFSLTTPEKQITVLPIPRRGRPDSFNGAVGDFQISATADRSSVEIGEPVSIELKIAGRGNFDRMIAPEIPSSNGWRNFGSENNFAPDDELEISGTQTFRTFFVPLSERAGPLNTPEFSYFNPQLREFITFSPESFEFEILVDEGRLLAEPDLTGGNWPLLVELLEASRAPSWQVTLAQISTQPAFWGIQALAFFGLIFLYRKQSGRRRFENDPYYREVVESRRRIRILMSEWNATDAGELEIKEDLLRQLLKAALRPAIGKNLDGYTPDEIMRHPEFQNLPAPLRERLVSIFQAIEAGRFQKQDKATQITFPSNAELSSLISRLRRAGQRS